jgi:hypothetical protein
VWVKRGDLFASTLFRRWQQDVISIKAARRSGGITSVSLTAAKIPFHPFPSTTLIYLFLKKNKDFFGDNAISLASKLKSAR